MKWALPPRCEMRYDIGPLATYIKLLTGCVPKGQVTRESRLPSHLFEVTPLEICEGRPRVGRGGIPGLP